MKKTIFLCGSALMLSAAALAFFVNSSKNTETSLLLRNVEALARNESGGNDCFSRVEYDSEIIGPYLEVRYCGSCTIVKATSAKNQSTCR